MVLRILFITSFLSNILVVNVFANYNYERITLYGHSNSPPSNTKSLLLNAETDGILTGSNAKHKREATQQKNNFTRVLPLYDRHKQLMVHWVGEGSDVIICLARDPVSSLSSSAAVNPSAVYISYDYGETFNDTTDLFMLENGSYSSVEKFYNHPNYNSHFVFTDVRNKYIFVTTNHGKNITRIPVTFTPSEVQFRELHPRSILILDKASPERTLYYSTDFGQSFSVFEEHVKTFTWTNNKQDLVLQRMLPSNLSSILYTKSLPLARYLIWLAKDVVDMYVKGDYVFFTKKSTSEDYDLFVSYKFQQAKKCIFDTELRRQAYQIVDITNDRALVSVSHTDMSSHLYVSESLSVKEDTIRYTLSLEYVLSYFPNTTWPDTWLHHVAEEPFTDIYKVEGLTGIYIASQVAYIPPPWNLGPQHLVTKITFDHGRSWDYIKSPERDNEGQLISCERAANCSLHLSQRFSQLYPDTRTVSILSSKSAPGILIATGVIGKSLKGHFGVYISADAGLTWKQSLKDLYFFNMGDHGGILTAVKYYKIRKETRHILYSTNQGGSWNEIPFNEEEIRLYGLMTEPGENTTIFTMFGSLPEEHKWIIVKIDLQSVFNTKCTLNDYKDWMPSTVVNGKSTIPCHMGQQLVYKRRMPSVSCYNGINYDFPVSTQSCECTSIDYECDFGFVRDETLGHCIRNKSSKNDPYALPENCNPGDFYNRTKGYRKVTGNSCTTGYVNNYEPDGIPCPFKEIHAFLLIAQRDKIIRLDPFTKEKKVLPITGFKNVIAIDFDMRNNCVFWADIIKDHIGRQCLNGSTANEILVNSNLSSVEGMAYDWISSNLYFVDGKNAKIELVKTDVPHNRHLRKTILAPPILKKPRGITVHPTASYLFWTDWAENPSISRSNLDGSDVTLLFTKPTIQWPNGITIDHIAERIYWVDAKEDYIGSSDLHGHKFKKVLTNTDYLSHPFSVAVFKDVMYWDDWKKNSIFSADKDHGIEISVLTDKMPGLMEMKIYAHSIQTGTNGCSNASCPFICVSVKDEPVCLCPDALEPSADGKCLCPGGKQPFANMTCPQYQSTCSSKYFACNNGQCIPKSWQCDKDKDCSDGEDEMGCDAPSCGPLFFACDDGTCLPEHLKCDYDLDCRDSSDEKNCPVHNCTEGQFTCKNGRCISLRWVCDSDNDCRDWSDEQNCYSSEPLLCKRTEFTCKTGGIQCIPSTWVCDNDFDCKDRSDELNCTNSNCSDYQFQCGGPEKKCILKEWVCDGDNDCEDQSDEANCKPMTSTTEMPTPHLPIANSTCHDWMFMCGNKKCIPTWWKCDGAKDCEDGSDEVGCNHPQITTEAPSTEDIWKDIHVCGPYSFQCSNGDCIDASWVCDGSADCIGGDDELHCTQILRCNKDQFKCRRDGNCIHIDNVCNGKPDCPDGSDEISSCTQTDNIPDVPATASCATGFFPCDVVTCVPMAMLCDGKPDCDDGFDERSCSSSKRYYQVLEMGVDDRTKNESSMLLYWWLPIPDSVKLEFLPSISEVGSGIWNNKTWIAQPDYQFTKLKPYTKYNMTIYVRIANTDKAFSPARYYTYVTGEGTPTVPTNVTVKQQNGSHILVSWGKPEQSNGIIQYYELCWYPPSPPIKLNLSDNTTAHLLSNDFQPDVTYNFYVVAYNGKYASSMSEVKKIIFDGDVQIDVIRDLTIVSRSDNNITLSWTYIKPYDGFIVEVEALQPFPKLPSRNTTTTNITITNLAPGVFYTFKVRSFKKEFQGPESAISASSFGNVLPELKELQIILVKESGIAVKLSWDISSKDSRKVNWEYGIYYGLTEKEMLSRSKYNTTNLTATIFNLEACESYMFGIGIVGPLGIGPIALRSIAKTYFNSRAPPKKLSASLGPDGLTSMLIQWEASCPSANDPIGYVVTANERVKNITKSITFPNITKDQISRTFDISQGGIYEITVSTDVVDALPSKTIIYSPPPIPPPLEVQAIPESNGSYFVYWQEHKKPSVSIQYLFEVLVSEGSKINESIAQVFEVEKPPFIYSNRTANEYSFAVRLKTAEDYRSVLSEVFTVLNPIQSVWRDNISKTSLTTVLVIVCMMLIIMGGAFGFLYMRHKRLQNSFTRFANSHYDTRADAATFEDNGLEEDDTPQIRGFSDDEPLVIA